MPNLVKSYELDEYLFLLLDSIEVGFGVILDLMNLFGHCFLYFGLFVSLFLVLEVLF